MNLDTGEFNRLHLRLDELETDLRRVESRVSGLESELWSRIDALEARSRAIEAQVSRQTSLFMDLQRELSGWRNIHLEEIRKIREAHEEATERVLKAIRGVGGASEYK